MNRKYLQPIIPIILVLLLLQPSCTQRGQIDDFSFKLGSVSGFCELVAADVKQLALSSVMDSETMDAFIEKVKPIAEEYGVSIYREDDLIVTDLFPADVATGKEVLIIYKGNTIDAYLELKEAANDFENQSMANRQGLSRRFGRMLSYSPQKINSLLASNTAFRTLQDFGIRANNLFLYYDDLKAATSFYTDVIGLELMTEYDNASIVRVAGESYLILVDAAKGMHSTEEPKTVALALLTNQLGEWYGHMKDNNVTIKYDYKPKDGGAHDGFVAVDPEGYLLEFETFKQHPENERFMPYLNANVTIMTANEGLGINGTITWLYYKDMLKMQQFYEEVIGLELIVDQGWAKVYRVTDSGYIGLVDERRGMHQFSEDKAVTVSVIINDLDGWYNYVKTNQTFELRSKEIGAGPDNMYRAFVGFDPEGYFHEFDRFYEHPTNETLMKYLGSN